jgi:hypothetical protein
MAEQKYGMFPVNVARRIFINAGGGGDREVREFVQRSSSRGGGDAKLAITPAGGIAARTTTAVPHTFPSATCRLISETTGNYFSPDQTEIVYNSTRIAIAAGRLIQIKKIGTRYFADVDGDC